MAESEARSYGFDTLFKRESTEWWSGRRWQIQTLLGVGGLCGILALVLFVLPGVAAAQGEQIQAMEAGREIFFALSAFAVGIAAIILTQDTVIGERKAGIAEWVLSKPVSRSAYIMAKLAAHTLGVLVTLIALPGLVAYGLFSLKLGRPLAVQPYLLGIAVLVVHTLFYIALNILMGVVAETRSALLGASLGTLFAGMILPDFIGKAVLITPWALPNLAVAAATTGRIPAPMGWPIAVTVLLTVGSVVASLWFFERADL